MSVEAIVGEEATFEISLINANGDPVDPKSAPTWKIFDTTNEVVQTGHGVQDNGDPTRWYCQTIIPDGVVPTHGPNEFFVIRWSAKDNQNREYSFQEKFKVNFRIDLDDGPSSVVMGIEGDTSVTDVLITRRTPLEYSYQLLNPLDPAEVNPLALITTPIPTQTVAGEFYFQHEIDISGMTLNGFGFESKYIQWIIEFSNGAKERELHPFYLTSFKLLTYVQQVRQRIDKGNLLMLNPALNFADWEIVNCIITALDRFNIEGKTTTSWNFNSMPQQGTYLLIELACYEALRELYLAEGLSAFDFQGQSTQLTSDRTSYIQTVMETMNAELVEKIKAFKTRQVRSKVGILSIKIGPNTNYPVYVDPASMQRGRLRSMMFGRR